MFQYQVNKDQKVSVAHREYKVLEVMKVQKVIRETLAHRDLTELKATKVIRATKVIKVTVENVVLLVPKVT
jgi:hypothetical protein